MGRGAAGLYREAYCGGSPVCGWGAWLCLETIEVAASAMTTTDWLHCNACVCVSAVFRSFIGGEEGVEVKV